MSIASLQAVLLFGVLPTWIAAGFADWACHRATRIERTTGSRESLLHLAMLVEVGIPLLAALFLEVNALVFALMVFAFIAHEATALWDVSLATHSTRPVSAFEQHVHSFLELLPLFAILCLVALHPMQFLALFRVGPQVPSFAPVLKTHPLGPAYVVALLLATLLLNVGPFAEELYRCVRTSRKGHASAATS
ncbi:diguanylate cyclase [Paraburkholderia tropica]|uniref:diguanylate cyclase n=1 Tax=Paraburkholderia tropica TaxID=92647 RepID=UPI0007ECB8F8|nr:diguanylate cyclase [Paraburkholderia tropica]OBR46151.1 diguanylate cyclase [Paraburkholderia tropica]